jgi:hypothetical protein
MKSYEVTFDGRIIPDTVVCQGYFERNRVFHFYTIADGKKTIVYTTPISGIQDMRIIEEK